MAVLHLMSSAVQRDTAARPPSCSSLPGWSPGLGAASFPDFPAACQSRDVARCLGLQTSHLWALALVPGMTRRWCCQQLHGSFVARAITERNKTTDVPVSQDDLVALAPAAPLPCAGMGSDCPVALVPTQPRCQTPQCSPGTWSTLLSHGPCGAS